MANLAHAFNGSAVCSALQSRYLNLQAKKLDALSAILNPLSAACQIVLNATQELIGNPDQLSLIDLIDKVAEPLLSTFCSVILVTKAFAIQRDRHRAIRMLNAKDFTVVILLNLRTTLFNDNTKIIVSRRKLFR